MLLMIFFPMDVWGNSSCGYSFQASLGASGGLLTIWDTDVVEVWSTSCFNHALVIRGQVISTGIEFIIVNVYGPCDTTTKQVLWDNLTTFVFANSDATLCLCGDFNSVRSVEEWKGCGATFRQQDADIFNTFIIDSLLLSLPICGRLFTWYRGDGYSISRLDKFLLSSNWCSVWPNLIQVAHQCGLSNHIPLVLFVDEENWGPRPLHMLKCWTYFPDYADFVRNRRGSFVLNGCGSYVLKEKPKLIKGS